MPRPPVPYARAHRAGFCAIVGRPNVGKSTLLNAVLHEKLAIVSRKPQTTRNRLLGVYTRPDLQVAFLDTPGIHKAKGALNQFMVEQALGAIHDVDVVLFLIEPTTTIGEGNQLVVDELKKSRKPILLGVNKIDTLPKHELLPILSAWKEVLPFAALYPLSALKGDGVDKLVDVIGEHLPEGPPLFDADVLTDAAERFLVAEYVREQLLLNTHEEVPYGAAVVVEEFDESERDGRNLVRIAARVYVERDSQKAIVIGKRGAMLKKIGTAARRHIERLLGARVFLQLEVAVEPRWTEKREGLRRMGYGE